MKRSQLDRRGSHPHFVLEAYVEILHASPVKSAGAQHRTLSDAFRMTVWRRRTRGKMLRTEIVDEHDVDEGLVEEADQQSAAVRGDAEGGCAVVWLLVIHGPR